MGKELVLSGRYYSENLTPDGVYKPELFGYKTEELRLSIDQTAFMLIDVYGTGYSDDEPEPIRPALITRKMFLREKEMINERIRPARDIARQAGLKIVYVTNSDPKIAISKGEFGKMVKRMHGYVLEDEFSDSGEALAFSKAIAPERDDFVVKKFQYDGFFESPLDSLLRNLEIKNLIAVGFAANICLMQTLHGAFYRNYRTVLLRDCTLALEYPDTEDDLMITKESIRYIERLIGFTVTFEEFKNACQKVTG
ncbi:MAG: isochorismatase family protein [Actinobacteria bacterium]|nr:isochorismatase family protein [Actinomycetota bacterium]